MIWRKKWENVSYHKFLSLNIWDQYCKMMGKSIKDVAHKMKMIKMDNNTKKYLWLQNTYQKQKFYRSECWTLKGQQEKKGGSSKMKMLRWMRSQHKRGQDIEWLYTRRYWCDIDWGKDCSKSVKVVWTCAKKATKSIDEESKLYYFWLYEKQETKKDNKGNC